MTDFAAQYQSKLMQPQQIAAQFQSGYTFMNDSSLAQPPAIMAAIDERVRNGELEGITQCTCLELHPRLCYQDPSMLGKITGQSWFSGAAARNAVNNGYADVMPSYYRDMPVIIEQYLDLDVHIAAVSPMDRHGYFSAGLVGSNTEALMKKAKHIFLEVNENMPRCLTSPIFHISQISGLCENTVPLVTLPDAQLDETSLTIGNIIAEQIPNGATIQLGIGAIPDAVGMALKGKKNLGIHTEMFTTSMVDLIECGAVDNSLKPIHTGRTVATFALGSQRIYDYINDNPAIQMLPVDYVNNPEVIAQHPNFVSINAALEVDFFGQVAAESVGTYHVSGTGGQVDYVRGAVQSKGGMSFIAFPSTAKNGTVSKISPTLAAGAIVTTSKNDVDCIVTEYGIAKLRGQTLSQRVRNLIAIAHPNFRDELTFAAKQRNILF
jgi:Acetyl-CoA hydrolase